ncbi:MAG: trigger factor [Bdellovibrionales bacterium]|nr:trigger factor [Bdellovibrionales bacterium]
MDNIQIQCKKIGHLQYEMQVKIAPEEVQRAFHQVYRRFQQKVSLPGFRKGRIPVDHIKKNYFSQVQSDVVQNLVEKAYLLGLKENKLNPTGSPQFDFQPVKEEAEFHFKVRFETHPEVQIKHYENLQIKAKKSTPSDKEVQKVIDNIRNSSAQIKPIEEERPCKTGDIVFIDLSGQIKDGKSLPLQKNIPVELGKGAVFKDIETALVSMKIKEEKEVETRFPKEHPEFPDKQVTFKIQLNKISEKILPEASDKWAQTLKAKDLADLKSTILKELQSQAEQSYQNELRQKALEQLIEKNPIEPPESVVQSQKEHIQQDIVQRLKQQKAPEEHIQKYVKDHEKDILKKSKWNAQAAYLVQALSKQLNIRVPENQGKAMEDSMRWHYLQSKVLDSIVQKAQVTQ